MWVSLLHGYARDTSGARRITALWVLSNISPGRPVPRNGGAIALQVDSAFIAVQQPTVSRKALLCNPRRGSSFCELVTNLLSILL